MPGGLAKGFGGTIGLAAGLNTGAGLVAAENAWEDEPALSCRKNGGTGFVSVFSGSLFVRTAVTASMIFAEAGVASPTSSAAVPPGGSLCDAVADGLLSGCGAIVATADPVGAV